MSLPRSLLNGPRQGYPAYGALHEVVPNEQLRGLLFDAAWTCDYVFRHQLAGEQVKPVDTWGTGERPVFSKGAESVQEEYDPRKFYRVFDIETLGVTVVEMDPSAKQARQARAVWEGQDFGAVEQEAKDDIGRRLPVTRPRLFFDRLIAAGNRLPHVPSTEVRQKVALAANPARNPETLALLNGEFDIIVGALRRRLKQYTYPWDFIPHMSFLAFRNQAEPESISAITESLDNYLAQHSFGAALEGLSFRHKIISGRPGRH